MLFEGLYTAIVTPFTKDNTLDEEGLKNNIEFQIRNGVDGIVVLGTTGESSSLSEVEKIRVIEIAKNVIKNRVHLVVGTGSNSTSQTIENTIKAQSLGADAVLIIVPYYNKPTQEGLYLHFQSVSQQTNIPICLYNHPGRTGQNLQLQTLIRLMEIPSIVAIKEASGNLCHIGDIIAAAHTSRPEFKILSGDDVLTLPSIALGAHGSISVVSNLFPGLVRGLIQAALKNDIKLAKEWHYTLLPIMKDLFIETNPIPIKAAMEKLGMAAGLCRLPLCALDNKNKDLLFSTINNLPSHLYPNYLGVYGQAQHTFS